MDAVQHAIYTEMKARGWNQQGLKFAQFETHIRYLCNVVYGMLDPHVIQGLTQDEFYQRYKRDCQSALNHVRQYAQQGAKKACDYFMDKNNGKLPSEAVMKKIKDRTIDHT